MGHKKWATITYIHLHKLFKQGVSTSHGASSPRANHSSTCQICNSIDHVATICLRIGDLKSKRGKCGDLPHRTKNYGVRCGYCIKMNHIENMLEEGERCQTMSLQPIINYKFLLMMRPLHWRNWINCVGPNMISFVVQNYQEKGCKWRWRHQKLIKLKTKPWKHDQWIYA